MRFLVDKPQFDVKEMKVGDAIAVTIKTRGTTFNNTNWLNKHCLITEVTPLELTVCYVDAPGREDYRDKDRDSERSDSLKHKKISVEEVSSGMVELYQMQICITDEHIKAETPLRRGKAF